VHYKLQPNWAAYGQYAVGDQIPDTAVFDVTGAKVSNPPKPTKSKTFQFGSVWKSDSYTLDVDIYHTALDSAYTIVPDPANPGFNLYPLAGNEVSQGVEAESNIVLGSGFSLYVNGTVGSTKYNSGKWVANAPSNTETLGLNYAQAEWNSGLQTKRVGKMYNDGTDLATGKIVVNEAFVINPVVLTNVFVNYTIKNSTSNKKSKVQFAVNNLFNNHSVVGVAGPVQGSSSANPLPGDLLTVVPARSASVTLTVDL
jgi:iron complex outermembrane receptor protein